MNAIDSMPVEAFWCLVFAILFAAFVVSDR